jgi:hypothetical protein
MGMEVFQQIPLEAPLVVAEAIWQYSHHVLAGLRSHRGPILTVANFAGRWPGLVGLLGLNAGMAKMGRSYSSLWTVDGSDSWFKEGIASWVQTGEVQHDESHVQDLPTLADSPERELGHALAGQLLDELAIVGVFDEGCMGMYNAIFDDEILNPIGIYKERLSQSALWAEMQQVSDEEAAAVGRWLEEVGMRFVLRRADRADPGAAAVAVQDVCRGAPDQRRLRSRRGGHPVPAGAKGSRTCLGSGRGPAQQRGTPPGDQP